MSRDVINLPTYLATLKKKKKNTHPSTFLKHPHTAMALRFEAGLPEAHPAISSIMMKMAAAHRDKVGRVPVGTVMGRTIRH